LRRKQRKKQEEQEDLLNLPQQANFGSDINLPSDYVMSMNCSSGYGSTIINETIKEEEEEAEGKNPKIKVTRNKKFRQNIFQSISLKNISSRNKID